MSTYIVTRERLAVLLGDPRVYERLPEFDEIRILYGKCYQESRDSGACCGKDIIPMFPVLREAVRIIYDHRGDPDFVARLRDILQVRRGRSIGPFVIHYRESIKGRPQRIAFR